ncbi:MAG: BspA family leucine-rich repeat surface protein, partial [Spirochaetota bacterium]
MFADASKFNNGGVDALGNWNVSNVTTMDGMFTGAIKFNQDLSSWDVNNVTDVTDWKNKVFAGATQMTNDKLPRKK